MSLDNYEILTELGRDDSHVSYRARHRATVREVVLQMTYRNWNLAPAAPGQLDATRRRLRAIALLDHPNLLPVLDVGDYDGGCYLVRPFLGAPPLDQLLRRHGPIEPRQAAEWALQLAEGIHHAHEHGIFGCDLGAGVVLIEQGRALLNLSDARHVRFLPPTLPPDPMAGLVMGNPATFSPERLRDVARPDDARGDVWALGVLLYRMLTGGMPFVPGPVLELLRAVLEDEPPRPRSLRPDVAADLESICLRCLKKEPENRYPDMWTLAEALRAYLEGRPVDAGEKSLVARMGQWVRGWWPAGAKG
jgi:serine/threonine protein kinase